MKRSLFLILAGCELVLLAVLISCEPGTPMPSPTPVLPTHTSSPVPLVPSPSATPEGATIRGTVINANSEPVPGATVRIQATENKTLSASNGSFTLFGLRAEETVVVTAWFAGYYVGWAEAVPGSAPVTITLKPYYTTDNPDYTWFSHEGAQGSLSCSHCMPSYNEWIHDAHSQSVVNPRFLTMYNGTDIHGNQSPLTRYGFSREYGRFPLRPDPNQPYYGPGYKLDFPETAGNCATCHVPAMTARPGLAYAADPNLADGIELEGVFCEFCHKIGEVTLNPETGLPYPNMPGVLSLRLYRPDPEQQLFFGNFDDVTRRVSYNSLYEQSQYCAPCHFGVFWDTIVYNSFGEWLASPYSDSQTGKTCQNCHMPTVDYDYFVYPEKGGLIRDRSRIFSHRMPGASDEKLLQNTADLDVTVKRDGGLITVSVSVFNANAGHDIPTDSPLRQILLSVKALDKDGKPIPLKTGLLLPDWTGDYNNTPGIYFAKILEELWTEVSPSGSYWMQTRIIEDTRLPALETRNTEFVFEYTEDSIVTIDVSLIFRRAFFDIMQQKGWNTPDILMEQKIIELP